jgi:DNA-directed RNA polymerase subunit RPC12/RpoP
MAGSKVKCATCGQRILVPAPPPQSKVGTNKTTLGKVITEDETPVAPVATKTAPAQDTVLPISPPPEVPEAPTPEYDDRPRRSKKRRRSRYDDKRYDDEYDHERDDDRPERDRTIRCPFCRKKMEPYIREEISQQGWILFAVLLLVFFPLCFLGLFMKEKVRYCERCNSRLDRGGMRF